jgi:hypothetical protein
MKYDAIALERRYYTWVLHDHGNRRHAQRRARCRFTISCICRAMLNDSILQPSIRRKKAGMAGDSNVSLTRLVGPAEMDYAVGVLFCCSACVRVLQPCGLFRCCQRDKKSLLQDGLASAAAIRDGECSARPRATALDFEAENPAAYRVQPWR